MELELFGIPDRCSPSFLRGKVEEVLKVKVEKIALGDPGTPTRVFCKGSRSPSRRKFKIPIPIEPEGCLVVIRNVGNEIISKRIMEVFSKEFPVSVLSMKYNQKDFCLSVVLEDDAGKEKCLQQKYVEIPCGCSKSTSKLKFLMEDGEMQKWKDYDILVNYPKKCVLYATSSEAGGILSKTCFQDQLYVSMILELGIDPAALELNFFRDLVEIICYKPEIKKQLLGMGSMECFGEVWFYASKNKASTSSSGIIHA